LMVITTPSQTGSKPLFVINGNTKGSTMYIDAQRLHEATKYQEE
jgi:hypothetical protein